MQDSSTALSATIQAGDLGGTAALIDHGINVNARRANGLSVLMIAAGLGQSQMVDLLLTAGADVLAIEPRMGASALHKAAQGGNPDVIGLLLDHGAFIDQQSPVLGVTALVDAVLYKREEAVRILLDRGARTGIPNHWGQTAVELARADGLSAIADLIEARDEADREAVEAMPLVAAIKRGDLDGVGRLIAEGARLDARVPMMGTSDDDYTPLGLAVREGHVAIVRTLLAAGADPRRTIGLFRGTPVHEAAYFGRDDILRLFVAEAARPGGSPIELDAQGAYNGLTPLHDAAWHGHEAAARVLAEAGARLDLASHAGLTPAGLAHLYGYHDLARDLDPASCG